MLHGVFGSAFVLFAAAVYAYYYREHTDRSYRTGKTATIGFGRSFRIVNPIFQFTTGFVCISALLTESPLLLKWHHSPMLVYFGLALSFFGIITFIWAKKTLGRAYSPCFDSYVPTSWVRRGLYRYVRHPIYFGNLMLLFGLFVASGSLWLGGSVLLATAYYIPSAIREEAALSEHFPEYREYTKCTKRFIPFLY